MLLGVLPRAIIKTHFLPHIFSKFPSFSPYKETEHRGLFPLLCVCLCLCSVPESNTRLTLIFACLPGCQSALQPWVSLGLLYNQSPTGVRFLNTIIFYRMGLLAPCPTLIFTEAIIGYRLFIKYLQAHDLYSNTTMCYLFSKLLNLALNKYRS
jgi:hypothetical protein